MTVHIQSCIIYVNSGSEYVGE